MIRQAPRIYNLFPLLAGPVAKWGEHLPRIREMGFTHVFLNPFHYPGFSGSLYAVKDYHRLHPMLAGKGEADPDELIGSFIAAARGHGLGVVMDLVINHTARDSVLAERHPRWFAREADGSLRSPRAVDPDDPEQVTVWGDLAELDYAPHAERAEVVGFFRDLVRHQAELGFAGFRCDAAYQVPADVWREVIGAAREVQPDTLFLAETLGCTLEQVEALRPAGFDYLFNSAKWWDFRAPWLLEQYDAFRHIAPSIAFPESHDTPRLGAELEAAGYDEATIESIYRQRYLFCALFSAGVMMPVGYEYGFRRALHVVDTRPEHWEKPRFDLTGFIAEVNRLKGSLPVLNREAEQHAVDGVPEGVVALLRGLDRDDARVLVFVNADPGAPCSVDTAALALPDDTIAGAREITPDGEAGRLEGAIDLPAAGARAFRLAPPATGVRVPAARSGGEAGSVVIGEVHPQLDCGRHAVKREVGDWLEASATIFKEGHERIAAVVLHRRAGAGPWRETPMRLESAGLDRWVASFPLEVNGAYEYTIEAWPDDWTTWCEELGKKREAGQDVGLELIEGRTLVAAAVSRARSEDAAVLEAALADFDQDTDPERRARLLTGSGIAQTLARAPDRARATRYDRVLEVWVDRVQARFAAWYEMFHRSQGTVPGRSATFADCERRLPEVRAMGFDVVYFVPIHPIGRLHRKGPDNTLTAGPDDPGSPYAIGSEEGGHTAVHPDLGTLEDFRSFVRAARAQGMEVALDFAIQCAPDHPWVREHPEWFRFRPDGTIRYAENPPKKYQDIVNVDFHGPHREELWRALRDVVLFWVEQGVHTFRVDNPHTKPVPFWEWLIRDVRGRHPQVIFLSEAFTRPPMLKQLAKVGFSQSYTYFTWRNFKDELTGYLTELTQTEVREYLRPNLFTSTPDILPYYLQTGGRPAFMIRQILAATLSSVYGICNGFELCEAAAVAGKEEYLHSEKYDYKVWDWDRPGHIKEWITAINRIRRENPALHELDNLRFHPAGNENVLFYGKTTHDGGNAVFVAVNLDPFDAHESDLEFPLAALGLPEDRPFEVEELLGGERHLWQGARQRVRLEPGSPAAMFRLNALERVDFREPCF